MLNANVPCFISVPNPENKRVLIPGKVLQVSGEGISVQFEEPVNAAPGSEVTLFGELRGKFHQQPAKISAITSGGAKPVLQVTTTGEPVSAESRGAFRVSVVSQDLSLTVNNQPAKLADLSADGIAILSGKPLAVGTSVEIDLQIESIFAKGSLRVQTEKKTPGGQLRYGLYAAERKGPMRKSLEALTSLMQRRQLQRLARAA